MSAITVAGIRKRSSLITPSRRVLNYLGTIVNHAKEIPQREATRKSDRVSGATRERLKQVEPSCISASVEVRSAVADTR